jgi:branched-chain amino acid transport system permease protein
VSHPVEGMSLMFGRAAPEICAAASCSNFPLTKAFMMVVALLMLVALWLLLTRTRVGLVIQASLTHPEMAEALGHNVPRVLMLVFGSGCALAGLAGVIGGITFVTEPNMAAFIGAIIFVVVVVGGIGSLAGAFVGSLVVGLLQTLPLTVDGSLASALTAMGFTVTPSTPGYPVLRLALKDVAQILPYLLMVLILIFRPKGLLGTRED